MIGWEMILPSPGFRVLPRRWVVERTFAWLGQNRRLSKEYERLPEISEAMIHVAMSRLMLRRLTPNMRLFRRFLIGPNDCTSGFRHGSATTQLTRLSRHGSRIFSLTARLPYWY